MESDPSLTLSYDPIGNKPWWVIIENFIMCLVGKHSMVFGLSLGAKGKLYPNILMFWLRKFKLYLQHIFHLSLK